MNRMYENIYLSDHCTTQASSHGHKQSTLPRTEKHTNQVDRTQPSQPTLGQDIASLLLKIAAISGCFIVMFSFVFGVFRYNDQSMYPNIKDGDMVISYRLDKTFIAGDVVAFLHNDKIICGRVVAIANDQVNITPDGLMVNNNLKQESDVYGKTTQLKGGITFPLTVPPGELFVLADNREHGTDSRILGCIKASDSQGKTIAIFRRRNL